MHEHLENLLKKITLGIKQLHQLRNVVNINFEENISLQKDAKKSQLNAIRTLKNKMAKLEDKFITDQITSSVYKEWQKKINLERKAIERTVAEDSFDIAKTEQRITKLFKARLNLFRIYNKSTTVQKQLLIRIIFRDTLMWDDGKFSASYFHQTLRFNLKKKSMSGLLSICENSNPKTIRAQEKNCGQFYILRDTRVAKILLTLFGLLLAMRFLTIFYTCPN